MAARSSALLATLVVAMIGVAFWFYRTSPSGTGAPDAGEAGWLQHLYSQNPRLAQQATAELNQLGQEALPRIREVLTDPAADEKLIKAALKATGILGEKADPLVDEVALHLTDPRFTEEAAVALSFMGREAYAPLQQGMTNDDPVVRRESLRSLGKLRERAPLDAQAVVPLLLEGLDDEDADVRVVAATYLGILGDDAAAAVPALIEGLSDEEAEVRAAAATALGSFGEAGVRAIPALRKAARDQDEEVAREAGLAIVKLQSSSRK